MKSASSPPLDFRNTNSLWGSVLVETLYRLGLRHAVISPGSRSTPLTMAFARHKGIDSISVLDERSAAFFALGLAKRENKPVVLLCTSGTAGANYFPAVIEAQESGVPLLVLTADRPPELRDCHSGQTIDQQKLFGSHVNHYHELAAPEGSAARLRYLRQTIVHAWERSLWPVSGPVHLNAPFRDPLPPIEDGSVKSLRPLFRGDIFFAAVRPFAPTPEGSVRGLDFPAHQRGIIIAGPAEGGVGAAEAGSVGQLARKLGWAVLADGLSGLRGVGSQIPSLITGYDSIVRSPRAGRRLKPEVVICVGSWPTSKPLRSWLERCAPEVWLVTTRVQNQDALHLATRHFRQGLQAFSEGIVADSAAATSAYTADWCYAEKMALHALDRGLARAHGRFEGTAVRVLAEHLPKSTPLLVANSMPVRDVEYFWPDNDRAHRIYCNRGANGIDGTLSTAQGLAHGGLPSVLLTGDLAFLHDTNGLLSVPRFKGSLTIVLINNQGGGIFEHLPVAQFNPPFEEFFATPQQVDFGKLCRAYGVSHVVVRDWLHLGRLLENPLRAGVRVLEVRTDRKKDAAFRKKLFVDAADAVERGWSK